MDKSSENRKIQYTKMVIKESLFTLLQEKPLKHITVKSLCELADINRGTFYAHYADIYDLVHQLEEELSETSRNIVNLEDIGKKDQYNMYKNIFTQLKDNIEEYKLILLNPESIRSLDRMLNEIYEHHVAALSSNKNLSLNMIDYIFAFFSQGMTQVIYKWIGNGQKESPEEMAKLILAITQNKEMSV